MKWCKRLIYEQFVQISGLCGPQFLSYLPKRRALYGDAIYTYTYFKIYCSSAIDFPMCNYDNILF